MISIPEDIPALADEVSRSQAEREFDAVLAPLDSAEIVALRAEVARLRAAVGAVEWIQDTGDGEEYCAWCLSNKRMGHSLLCQRQVALGLD